MDLITILPSYFLVLFVSFLIFFTSRRFGHIAGCFVTIFVSVWSFIVPKGKYLETVFLGFDVVLLNIDQFSKLMGIIFGLIGTAAILYSYASKARNIQTAYALSYIGTSLGAVFSGDWLTLVFFWELMAITSTLLVWDFGGEAVRAGFRYALYHGLGGSLLMAGVILHYTNSGSFLFSDSTGISGGLAALLVAVGIGVNVGFIGLHTWLPDTYPRPHIAASVFLCVYTTKTGVYAMARAFPDGHLWIAYMGGSMAVFGAGIALLQNDMRRLLSYHIQSQVGYMIAGVGIGTALSLAGAFAHVYNHILYKALLFMTAGVVIYRTEKQNLKNLGGLYRKMPITSVVFLVAALSIAGFPGFNGFVSKGMVISAAHKKHLNALWWLLMIGGLGTFLSFIKFGYYAFLKGEFDGNVKDANLGQSISMVFIAILCIIYGIFPDLLFYILPGSGAEKAHPFTLSHILEGLILAILGLIGFYIIKKPLSKIGKISDIDVIYNYSIFYGTRILVYAVTDFFSIVQDSTNKLLKDKVIVFFRNPNKYYNFTRKKILKRLINKSFSEEDISSKSLKMGIGISTLIIICVLSVFLFIII